MKFDLELTRVVSEIKSEKASCVCIQLPDGLKPEAKIISDEIRKETGATVIIWAGSCYGACDLPLEVERLGAQMLVQWGHAKWT